MRSLIPPVPVMVVLVVTAIVAVMFFRVVDLKPQVEENFFFSKQDPQVRADTEIVRTFPQSTQIVLAAAGDIASPAYVERVRRMSAELSAVPGAAPLKKLSLSLPEGFGLVRGHLRVPRFPAIATLPPAAPSLRPRFAEPCCCGSCAAASSP